MRLFWIFSSLVFSMRFAILLFLFLIQIACAEIGEDANTIIGRFKDDGFTVSEKPISTFSYIEGGKQGEYFKVLFKEGKAVAYIKTSLLAPTDNQIEYIQKSSTKCGWTVLYNVNWHDNSQKIWVSGDHSLCIMVLESTLYFGTPEGIKILTGFDVPMPSMSFPNIDLNIF